MADRRTTLYGRPHIIAAGTPRCRRRSLCGPQRSVIGYDNLIGYKQTLSAPQKFVFKTFLRLDCNIGQ